MQFPPEQVLVAPNGVELERYESLPGPEEARRQLGLPPGLTAGFTGHTYPGRGAEMLFALAQQLPQLNFLWVGGRPNDVTQWRTRTSQMGLANVTLTGFVANRHIPLYQAAGDLLLIHRKPGVKYSPERKEFLWDDRFRVSVDIVYLRPGTVLARVT